MSEIEDYEALLETASLRAELEQLRAKLAEAEARLADPSDRIRIAGLERALEAAQTEREAALRENVL